MNILGISFDSPGSAAVLIQNGRITAACQEDRFTRSKNTPVFPTSSIGFCLQEGRIGPGELDLAAVSFRPRILSLLRTRRIIAARIGLPEGKIRFSDPLVSQASSSFFCSPFSEAGLLIIDGEGIAEGFGRDGTFSLRRLSPSGHSLSRLYSIFTAFLGFEMDEGEYKVMGLAAHGKPRFKTEIEALIDRLPDGSFRIRPGYIGSGSRTGNPWTDRFERTFGRPRFPDRNATEESLYAYADIAASVQSVLEDLLVDLASRIRSKYHSSNLCLAGGTSLNCSANRRIAEEAGFKEMFIQPASGPPGGAAGAALTWISPKPRLPLRSIYIGPSLDENEAIQAVKNAGLIYGRFPAGTLYRKTAEALADGKIIGWVQERSEWGPRALGNRSILADPRNADAAGIVNARIKFREPFRPFAPSILREYLQDYFHEIGTAASFPVRLMQTTLRVRQEKREVIPAVVHADGTSRVQGVVEEDNPRFYRLIKEFHALTGVPVLLNTSFNLRGEPIVQTGADAVSVFLRSGLDLLVLGDLIVAKKA